MLHLCWTSIGQLLLPAAPFRNLVPGGLFFDPFSMHFIGSQKVLNRNKSTCRNSETPRPLGKPAAVDIARNMIEVQGGLLLKRQRVSSSGGGTCSSDQLFYNKTWEPGAGWNGTKIFKTDNETEAHLFQRNRQENSNMAHFLLPGSPAGFQCQILSA